MLYAGQEVVLKEYNVGDEISKKMFENQVYLMKRLANHPVILPIDVVFYDRNAYIQMQCIPSYLFIYLLIIFLPLFPRCIINHLKVCRYIRRKFTAMVEFEHSGK
jgi:hypothetical protein